MRTTSIKVVLIIILAGATAALSLFIRIPTPATGGYLNVGDMA
ncbi:MAG TPA: ECF transporter S component, partial [Coxiellaceae bacterium]|nr:ECF transporter S component [Coxiellaceae bacterium]